MPKCLNLLLSCYLLPLPLLNRVPISVYDVLLHDLLLPEKKFHNCTHLNIILLYVSFILEVDHIHFPCITWGYCIQQILCIITVIVCTRYTKRSTTLRRDRELQLMMSPYTMDYMTRL